MREKKKKTSKFWLIVITTIYLVLELVIPRASAADILQHAPGELTCCLSKSLSECTLSVKGTAYWGRMSGEAATHESILLFLYRFRMAAGTRHNSFFTPRILISFLWLKCKALLIWEPSKSSMLKAALCAFSKASGLVLKPRCGSGDWCRRGNADRTVCRYEMCGAGKGRWLNLKKSQEEKISFQGEMAFLKDDDW